MDCSGSRPLGRGWCSPGERLADLTRLSIDGLGHEPIPRFLVHDAPLRREVTVFTCHPGAFEEHATISMIERATPSSAMAKHDPPRVPHRAPMDLDPHLDPIPHVP